jgi:integrase
MARRPEIGAVQLYPNRPLRRTDKNGFVLKFYCPIQGKRIRKNCGTRDRREARRIQRECRERLINGEYSTSRGTITSAHAPGLAVLPARPTTGDEAAGRTWDEAAGLYRSQHRRRVRRKSKVDCDSRLAIAERVFEGRRSAEGLPPGVTLRECTTLDALEFLQCQLMDGTESRYASRSPNTVNSMMAAVMAFVRYCYDHEWIDRVPPLRKLEVDEVMKGRPITGEEFERMLAATPKVVGDGPAASWRFALQILWESGFRIADLLDFSWDDVNRIHPVWPRRKGQHPTLVIPSTQKNGKNEEVPMLLGLAKLLEAVPKANRQGFVVNPTPAEFEMKSQANKWFRPRREELRALIESYSNCAIARACGVSEQTVRHWLDRLELERMGTAAQCSDKIPPASVDELRRMSGVGRHQRRIANGRLSRERVSRLIAEIGMQAKVVVRQPDDSIGRRTKFASAHDLRRSCAERLINAGVSAETLMVVMRHKDFATTRRFYGAQRAAQSAAAEIHQKLTTIESTQGTEKAGLLNAEQMERLQRLLNSI